MRLGSGLVIAKHVLRPAHYIPPDPPTYGYYGSGICGDTLANTRVGGPTPSSPATKVLYRFRSPVSSALNSFAFYFLSADSPGYGAGTGGTWVAELFAVGADNYPTGAALASQSVAADSTGKTRKSVTFSSPYSCVSGTLYALVFRNTDASPTANYFSVDCWYPGSGASGSGYSGRIHPRFADTDWAHAYYDNTSSVWVTRDGYAPILDLTFADGSHHGMSYGEASYNPTSQVGRITSTTHKVRQRFTVSGGSRTVTGAGIRLLKITGTTTGLTVTLKNSGGSTIDSFTIAASLINTGSAPNGSADSTGLGYDQRWVSGSFAAQQTLSNGTEYILEFSTDASGDYYTWVQRKLSGSYSYDTSTAFADGYAEKTTNGSAWSSLGRVANENDLQFFFLTV